MPAESNKFNDIDKLLNSAMQEPEPAASQPKNALREKFEEKLSELKMLPTHVLDILNIEYRALNGILDGTQKRIDFITLTKLARLLDIPTEDLIKLYVDSLEQNFKDDISATERRKFISDNFDLITLKKVGFIDNITDFDHIENQIIAFFGFNSIFEYKRSDIHPAFSSGVIKPKNELTRDFWIRTAEADLLKDNNAYEFDRQGLIEYFPKIRWHSTDVENGLHNVMKSLYKLGVTLIFQPSMPTLHLRGATFAINEKPCIVLTDYKGFYPTLWFALIHELFHILFDWEEIKINTYHLSDEETDLFTITEKENEANHFAREYLFSAEKMNAVSPYINNAAYVKEHAYNNHVHPSFIYLFYAHDHGNEDKKAWAIAHKHMPDIKKCISRIGEKDWAGRVPIKESVSIRKSKISV